VSCIATVEFKIDLHSETTQRIMSEHGVRYLGHRQHKLFGAAVLGDGLMLRNWLYPVVVVETDNRQQLKYDNYDGHWGDIDILNKFLEDVEIARILEQLGPLGAQLGDRVDLDDRTSYIDIILDPDAVAQVAALSV